MKRYNTALLALALALGSGALIDSAEAARLGGGRSIGAVRSLPQRQALPAPLQSPQATPGQAGTPTLQGAATPSASWLGPMAGVAAGLGLGWLFTQGGMGPMLLGLLVMAAAIALIMRMARNEQPGPAHAAAGPLQYAGLGNETVAAPPPSQLPAEGSWGGATETATPLVPRDFDAAGFLDQARINFLRLQAANDQADLMTLRDMTTDALYAQLAGDIGQQAASRRSDVVILEAALLEVTSEREQHWASVRFAGQASEMAGAPPVPFAEVWHLSKPVSGRSGWLVAGIEQIG